MNLQHCSNCGLVYADIPGIFYCRQPSCDGRTLEPLHPSMQTVTAEITLSPEQTAAIKEYIGNMERRLVPNDNMVCGCGFLLMPGEVKCPGCERKIT